MALMKYIEPTILAPLTVHERNFSFVGREIVIQQDFQQHGVSAVVWEAAVELSHYFEKYPELIRGKRVLEMGAGTGLCGIVMALLGAFVTLTDHPSALDCLDRNVAANLPTSASPTCSAGPAAATPRERPVAAWSQPLVGLGRAVGTVTVAPLDWTAPPVALDAWTAAHSGDGGGWDVLVGTDIVYDAATFADLRRCLGRLSSTATVLLLATKIRYAERDTVFIESLQADGWDMQLLHRNADNAVVIHRLTKRQ